MVLRVFLLNVLFLQCSSGNSVQSEADNGKVLFGRYCSSCHGSDGKKMQLGASNLVESMLAADQQLEILRNGRKGMPSFQKILNEAELEQISAYTYSLRKK
jgi:cytochrome c6